MQSRLADGCNELAEAIPTVMFEEDQADDGYKGLHSDDDTEIETERIGTSSATEELGEDFLWQQLAQELHRQRSEVEDQSASEEEAAAAREITKEEEHVASSAASTLGQVVNQRTLDNFLYDNNSTRVFVIRSNEITSKVNL